MCVCVAFLIVNICVCHVCVQLFFPNGLRASPSGFCALGVTAPVRAALPPGYRSWRLNLFLGGIAK